MICFKHWVVAGLELGVGGYLLCSRCCDLFWFAGLLFGLLRFVLGWVVWWVWGLFAVRGCGLVWCVGWFVKLRFAAGFGLVLGVEFVVLLFYGGLLVLCTMLCVM